VASRGEAAGKDLKPIREVIVRTKLTTTEAQHRTFRLVLWIGRAIGWMLLFVLIVGLAAPRSKLLPSTALWLMAVAWVVGLEQFFRFIDRCLSGN
jgi:hypothetical protein